MTLTWWQPCCQAKASLILVGLMLVLSGCGDSGRQSLEGTVSFDGAPLPTGNIIFVPEKETSGPSAGGAIENGTFSITSDGGVFAGKFRIEITATRPSTTNKVMDYETGKMVIVPEQYIPAKYNKQSELAEEVVAGEANQFDFALTSNALTSK